MAFESSMMHVVCNAESAHQHIASLYTHTLDSLDYMQYKHASKVYQCRVRLLVWACRYTMKPNPRRVTAMVNGYNKYMQANILGEYMVYIKSAATCLCILKYTLYFIYVKLGLAEYVYSVKSALVEAWSPHACSNWSRSIQVEQV